MKELFTSLLNYVGLAYWVKIDTQAPTCTYYFGPFRSRSKAESASGGYVEDLKGEEAQSIKVAIQKCKPTQLTIFEEAESIETSSAMQMVSGRI
ncbi:MAG: DUF1816 domain-containing protein [Cyanobacteria bacterium P01_F01_bin.153]